MHYCQLEEALALKRRRKSFLKSTVEAGEVPTIRLALFCRTVRESPTLASRVELLKLPYMTRETSKGELARTISVLRNLQYVDLPDGVATGDPSCLTLLLELQARCPDIRKMSYRAGAESAFELLARQQWRNLEILDVSALAIEPSTLRIVLASLPALRELSISEVSWLDDSIFDSSPDLPEFPPLQSLVLENAPLLTMRALEVYLSHSMNRETMSSLSLTGTGVGVHDLSSLLSIASSLTSLAISETVTRGITLSTTDMPLLASGRLQTLHYEIIDSEDAHGLQKPSVSYYAHLSRSIRANALPALRNLYVRDPDFTALLLSTSPRTPNDGVPNNTNPFKPPSPPRTTTPTFTHPLTIFSKSPDELDWTPTICLLYTSPSPRDGLLSRMPSSA